MLRPLLRHDYGAVAVFGVKTKRGESRDETARHLRDDALHVVLVLLQQLHHAELRAQAIPDAACD